MKKFSKYSPHLFFRSYLLLNWSGRVARRGLKIASISFPEELLQRNLRKKFCRKIFSENLSKKFWPKITCFLSDRNPQKHQSYFPPFENSYLKNYKMKSEQLSDFMNSQPSISEKWKFWYWSLVCPHILIFSEECKIKRSWSWDLLMKLPRGFEISI